MISFFRKIRQSLLGSGQARKYLLYAVGEILLVVIGILIALEVNNWNEWRKDRLKEKNLLHTLMNDIDRNIQTIESTISLHEKRIRSTELILSVLESHSPYNDSLSSHFYYAILVGTAYSGNPFSRNGYEVLKNEGLNLISKEPLRNEIIILYEETYNKLESWAGYMTDFGLESLGVWDNFERKSRTLRPLNYSELLENTAVKNHFESSKVYNETYETRLNESLAESNRILHLIKMELHE